MDPTMEPITDDIPIDNIYWPEFKKAVEADTARVRPIQLECVICTELMTTSPDEPDHTFVGIPSHGAQILPCGHMIGASCWFEWIASEEQAASGKKYDKCPCCNTKIRFHSKCGHRTPGRFIPDTVAEYTTVPAVFRHGGCISPRCLWCELRHVMEMFCNSAPRPSLELQPGEYPSMLFHVEGTPLLQQYPRDHQPSQLDTIVCELEMPQELVTLWEVISLTWKLNSPKLWYGRDLAQADFAICVFRSYSPVSEPGAEFMSF